VQISLKNSKEFKEWHRDMEDFLDESINSTRKLLAGFSDIVYRATNNDRLREYISVVQSFDYFRDRLNVASKIERINLVSWGLREMSQLLINFGRDDNGDGFSLNESMSKVKNAKELAKMRLMKKQPSANDATEYFEDQNQSGFLPELSRSGRRSVDVAGSRGIPRTSTHKETVQRLDRRRSTSKSDRGERPERMLGSFGLEKPVKDVKIEDIVLEDSSHRDDKTRPLVHGQRPAEQALNSTATFDGTRRSQNGSPKAKNAHSAGKERPAQDFKRVETEVMTRSLKQPKLEEAVRTANFESSFETKSYGYLNVTPPLARVVVQPLQVACEREKAYQKAVVHPERRAIAGLEISQKIEAAAVKYHRRRFLDASTATRTVETAYRLAPPVFSRKAVEALQVTASFQKSYIKAPPVFLHVAVPGLEICRHVEKARFEAPPKIVVKPEQPVSVKTPQPKELDSALQTKPTTGSEKTARGEEEEAFNVTQSNSAAHRFKHASALGGEQPDLQLTAAQVHVEAQGPVSPWRAYAEDQPAPDQPRQ
jgi:hypothetical protein